MDIRGEDPVVWLRAAEAHVRVSQVRGHRRSADETRSYLGDGRVVVFRLPTATPAPGLVAVDAERRGQPVPKRLSRSPRFANEPDFWRAWTRFEVECKLQDVPVAVALRRDPPLLAEIVVHSFKLDDLAVTIGMTVGTRRAASDGWAPTISTA